ncbi:rRNA maturation RNase YbeY, partial [Klebsiella pneumoniae]|uniref:rRNA maturation RNase YbeY n=1 Tax=Klebsiella pneumoniae TaxID=573 RepID=UPI0027312EE2
IGDLNYVLMSDDELLEYNKRYLGHNDYTDVITFDGQNGVGISGDVLMSHDRIKENAVTFGVSMQTELHRVMVHGLLHLLGHSDTSKAQREAM